MTLSFLSFILFSHVLLHNYFVIIIIVTNVSTRRIPVFFYYLVVIKSQLTLTNDRTIWPTQTRARREENCHLDYLVGVRSLLDTRNFPFHFISFDSFSMNKRRKNRQISLLHWFHITCLSFSFIDPRKYKKKKREKKRKKRKHKYIKQSTPTTK